VNNFPDNSHNSLPINSTNPPILKSTSFQRTEVTNLNQTTNQGENHETNLEPNFNALLNTPKHSSLPTPQQFPNQPHNDDLPASINTNQHLNRAPNNDENSSDNENSSESSSTDTSESESNSTSDSESNSREESFQSNAFVPIEQRTISELENMTIQELDSYETPSRIDTLLWRIGICLVCLLLVWVTSLPVLFAFVSYSIPSPPMSQVVDRWGVTVDTSWNEIKDSTECYGDVFEGCEQSRTAGLTVFRNSMSNRFSLQDQALVDSVAIEQPCKDEYTNVLAAFHLHRELGYPILFDSTLCNQEQIQSTRDLLGYDDNSYANRILRAVDKVTSAWAEKFSNVTESINNRTRYDKAYIRKKVPEMRLQLEAIRLNYVNFFKNIHWDVILPNVDIGPVNLQLIKIENRWRDISQQIEEAWLRARMIWGEVTDALKIFPLDGLFPLPVINFGILNQKFLNAFPLVTEQVTQRMNKAQQMGKFGMFTAVVLSQGQNCLFFVLHLS
jgi:hypothetical protein